MALRLTWVGGTYARLRLKLTRVAATDIELSVLLMHLLKWQFQPDLRGRSWRLTIERQRLDIDDHLKDNPSLKNLMSFVISSAYRGARIDAEKESGLDRKVFPVTCPYTFEQMMSPDFWPE